MAAARTRADATTEQVARRYFAALAVRDLDAMLACWAPGGREHIRGLVDTTAPDGVRAFFASLFSAVPDFALRVEDLTVQSERAAVRWSATGTFAGRAPFNGLEPNGSRLELEGCDVLVVRDGLIQRNDAYSDSMAFARGIGLLPPEGSTAERRMFGAFNAAGRIGRRLAATGAEEIADGVWRIRGGFPGKPMNVYLVRDGDGVLAFDAGIRSMTRPIAAAALGLGGLTRVVLGHAHADHRGAAPGLGVPVLCHAAERADAEGDGGLHSFDLAALGAPGKWVYGPMLRHWDGGPVAIAGTLQEGDEVAGFEVVHLPGHAPGLIALWRASDGLALSSDCFYTVDPITGRRGAPRIPLAAFTPDREQARASIRKLAALGPATAWPGHADPVTGDVRAQLERAAAA
jgi:steroid delta-isomerase-like uncharacterized protein